MVRRLKEQKVTNRAPGINMHTLLEPAEMFDAGRLYARMSIEPGSTLALHRHDNEMESFYIVKGTCRFYDNEEDVILNAGDVLVTGEGEIHSIHNDGNETVELIALIISHKQGVPGSSTML